MLKCIFSFCFMCLSFSIIFMPCQLVAAEPMSEATLLGTLAGAAEACNAGQRLKDYELISGHILLNKATTKEAQRKAVFEFALAKLEGSKKQKRFPKISCADFLNMFYKQDIFNATVYQDGTVKLADGTILKSNRGAIDPAGKK